MVAGHFSNYFFDLGETKGIKFVRATSDKIAALDAYRGKSDSNFLFYLNGEQVKAIAGSNIPAIYETIKENAPDNDA